MRTLLYQLPIALLLLVSGSLTGQAEVFVNLLEGTPLPIGTSIEVQVDKLENPGETPVTQNIKYLDNRLLLALFPADGETEIPAGRYEVLVDYEMWDELTPLDGPATSGNMHTMVVTVDPAGRDQPRAQFAWQGGRKVKVTVRTIEYGVDADNMDQIAAALPNPPRMQLITEIGLERNFCTLSTSLAPSPDFFDATDGGDKAVARVDRVDCADEYDFEYVFYDEDSQVGQAIAANTQDDISVNDLFKNNATRLTSADVNFRLFHLYREGFVVARYRAVQYTIEGIRTYTSWSDEGQLLWADGIRYAGIVAVDHQLDYNWRAATSFAEDAKQLPTVNYMDGTMRSRQNLVLQYEEVNGMPRPEEEYVIGQQTLYDAMGRPAVQVLPAPLYPEEVSAHPLRFDPQSLAQAAGSASANIYDKGEIEAENNCGPVEPMIEQAGAGKFYSPNNTRIDAGNAYVPRGEGYPFAVTRYTPDNTGRIQRQGGVGPTLQLGANDTRYYYGKPNQWELDRLFGINVGAASHYEKRMMIDPDGQASVSYIDAKGRTIATALTGPVPDKYEKLPSHISPENTASLEVDILNNVDLGDQIQSSYSLLVTAPDTYDICYALAQVTYPDNCCGVNVCPDCRYDVSISLIPVDVCAAGDVQPRMIELNDIVVSGDINDCFGGNEVDLTNLELEIGEYRITKTIRLHEEAVRAATAEYMASATCLTDEETYVAEYLDRTDLSGCEECDCSLPAEDQEDACKDFCKTLSPCAVLEIQMKGDLSPGGQYAAFDIIENVVGPNGEVELVYVADPVTDPLSIFAPPPAPSTSAFRFVDLPWENLTVNIEGVDVGVADLSVRQFVDNFQEEWLDVLLEYHPEYCFSTACSADLDEPVSSSGGSDGWTSFEYDTWLRNTSEYAVFSNFPGVQDQAIEQTGSRNGVYYAYRELVDNDPYFINSPGTKDAFLDTYFSPVLPQQLESDFSKAFIAQLEIYFGENWVWPTDPAQDYLRDIVWRMLRDHYLGHKSLFTETLIRIHCEGAPHDIHGDDWRCLEQPLCATFDCPEVSGCGNSDYAGYVARQMQSTNTSLINDNQTFDLGAPLQQLVGQSYATVRTGCADRCESYIPAWRQLIAGCPLLEPHTEDILNEFSAICSTGCGEGKYFGTSSVPEGVTFSGRRSFEEVLTHYYELAAGPGACPTAECNPYLINFPPPAEQDFYGGTLTLGSDQVPIWLHANREFLRARLEFLEEDCACVACPPVIQDRAGKSAAGIGLEKISAMAVLNYMTETEVTQTVMVIDNFLNGITTGLFPTGDLKIPAELNNGGQYCTYVSEIQTRLQPDFDALVSTCAFETPEDRNDLFAAFLNTRLGWNRPWADYALVLEDSNPDTASCFICAQPALDIAPETTPAPTCEEEIIAQATEDALVAYDLYRDEKERDYEASYRAFCLGAVEEEMKMGYKPLEHHFTLYYYDQAGNLAMTVPPTGVRPISEADRATIAASVQQVRDGLVESTATVAVADEDLPKHIKLTHYGYNNFNAQISSDAPDKDIVRTWYDPVGRAVLSESGRQRELGLASYTLYDDLSRVVEVGEFPQGDFGRLTQDAMMGDGAFAATVMASFDRQFVTRTFYTETPFGTDALDPSIINLRNRVAATTFREAPGQGIDGSTDASVFDRIANNYDFASHYDYDVAGNVATLVQDFRELADIGHQYKKLEYDYDLISGNVFNLFYQRGNQDQFTYNYTYDKLNRLTETFSTELESNHAQSGAWKRDAYYDYYDHGPLRRTVMGQDRLQGVDYAYTLQGWIKGVNGSLGDSDSWRTTADMNDDGLANPVSYASDRTVYRDLYRYGLQFFDQNYQPLKQDRLTPFFNQSPVSYYNGNIFEHFKASVVDGFATTLLVNYADQLNRTGNSLTGIADTDPSLGIQNFRLDKIVTSNPFYDADGNINQLTRQYADFIRNPDGTFSGTASEVNDLGYNYSPGTNLLVDVDPTVNNAGTEETYRPFQFMEGQQRYKYDGSGNLLEMTDVNQNDLVTDLKWTPYGKVQSVRDKAIGQSDFHTTIFGYGPDQNRWVKRRYFFTQGGQMVTEDDEYQVRDAQGNTLAVYDLRREKDGSDAILSSTPFSWRQQAVYGSTRLGLTPVDRPVEDCADCPLSSTAYVPLTRHYEMSDHLGNVTTVFGERIIDYDDPIYDNPFRAPELITHQDYLPFGLTWKHSANSLTEPTYCYGFNGKEQDSEGEWGSLTHYDYGFRIYNPGIGRFLSVDPLSPDYPWYTPYQFAGNKPIWAIDLDGLEEFYSTTGQFLRMGPDLLSNDIFIESQSDLTSITLHSLLVLQNDNNLGLNEMISSIARNQKLNVIYGGPLRARYLKAGGHGAEFYYDGKRKIGIMNIQEGVLMATLSATGSEAKIRLDGFILGVAHEFLHLAQKSIKQAGILNDHEKGKNGRELLAHHFMLFPNSSSALEVTDFEAGVTNVFNEFDERQTAFFAHQSQVFISRLNQGEAVEYESYVEEIEGLVDRLSKKGWVFPAAASDIGVQQDNFINANRVRLQGN